MDRIIVMSLGKSNYEAAKSFISSQREKKEYGIIPFPGNIARVVWDNLNIKEPEDKLFFAKDYWMEEYRKCIESEEYFYNNYCMVNGKKPEPVPKGYFKKLRIFKSRRKGRTGFIPKINDENDVTDALSLARVKFNNKPTWKHNG